MTLNIDSTRLRDPSTIIALSLFIVFVLAVVGSSDFPAEGRLFPSVVGVVGALLAAAFVIRRLAGKESDVEDTQGLDLSGDLDIGVAVAFRRALRYSGWLIVYLVAMSLVGAAIATAAYIFFYLLLEGRAPAWKAGLFAAVVTIGLPVYLASLLGLVIPRGLFEESIRMLFSGVL